MKLILERNQRSKGMMSKTQVFSVTFRAEVSEKEKEMINTLSLADDILYDNYDEVDPGSGLLGLASRMTGGPQSIEINVRDLVNGKTVEVPNIVQMKAIEEQVKSAAANLKAILDTAATFGGREVIEL